MTFRTNYPTIRDLVDDLWRHPELGYQEHHTSQLVAEFLGRYGPGLEIHRFSTTGL